MIMNFKQKVKEIIMKRSLQKNIKRNPFNVKKIETYSLTEDASHLDTNSYYFSAHDLKGNSLLIRRAERGDNTVEVWIVLIYKDQLYLNRQQVFSMDKTPVKVACIVPGKTWNVTYHGDIYEAKIDQNLIASANGNSKTLNLTLNFFATKDIFDFSYHINPNVLAKALAKETWNKDFIRNIRENQQRHYEQQGMVQVELKLDDKLLQFEMRAMRDHSFGRRDWNYMNRHIWLMSLLEEDESLNVNMVSYPHMKDLQTGYYESKDDTNTVADAPNLRSFEVNGKIPNEITYDITLDTGKQFHVTAKKEVEIHFPFDNGSYTICEGIGTFNINGKKGRGIIEFGYNKDKTRW